MGRAGRAGAVERGVNTFEREVKKCDFETEIGKMGRDSASHSSSANDADAAGLMPRIGGMRHGVSGLIPADQDTRRTWWAQASLNLPTVERYILCGAASDPSPR